jgi:O-antigen ligase
MSTTREVLRRRPPARPFVQRGVAAVALGAAAALGGLVAVDPHLALAVVAAGLFVALLWYDLRLAIAAWIAVVFLEDIPLLNAAGKATGAAVALACVLAWPRLRDRNPLRGQSDVLVPLGLLGVWLGLSLGWAVDVGTTAAAIGQWYAVNVAFLVVATAMAERMGLRLAAEAFVGGALLSVLVGALLGGGDEGRFAGTLGDPNVLAAGLVPAAVLAVGLASGGGGPARRALGGAALVVLGGGLVASGSRGGLVGLVAALLVGVVVTRRRRAELLAVVAVLAAGAAAVLLWLQPAAWSERSASAGPGSGRADLWEVAWHMAGDHAVTGVGLGAYPDVAVDYVRRLGPLQAVDLIAAEPHEAHNLYLQLLAETGIVGFVLFVAFAAACLRSAWRAARCFDRAGEVANAALARAVLVAGIGMLGAEAFISAGVDRRLWALLALGPASLAAARGPRPTS